MAKNRERIAALRAIVSELEGRVVSVNKPYSKEVLPPMGV
jgi:BMFP domain-containing protein YqiC